MIEQHGTLEISRSRFSHNVDLLRKQLGPVKICAMLKANAYGHGAGLMAGLVGKAAVEWVAVYNLEEALALAPDVDPGIAIRGLAGGTRVLVLAPLVATSPQELPRDFLEAVRLKVRLNVIDAATAKALSTAVLEAGMEEPVNVHLQIDTGLTRGGVATTDAAALADAIAALPGLHLECVFAHFSHGDMPRHAATVDQTRHFHEVADAIKQKHPQLLRHLQNSGGAFHLTDAALDFARIGIALYGLQPSTADRIDGLLPIARIVAPILAIHEVPANIGVGYGHTFVTKRPSRLAIVPVGYAEGYPRALSNRGLAQIGELNVPVVGRVSMDQIILDVTDVAAKIGDRVTVISWHPEKPNAVDRIADATGTIGYEIATGFGLRLKRVVVD